MPDCTDPSSWTVRLADDGGSVECAQYRGRIRIRRAGIVQIIWQIGPGPKEDGPINRAAQEAIYRAMEGPV